MLGSAYFIIGAIALVVLQPSAAFNATTANNVCNLLQDGELIYSGENCAQYYTCSGGSATLSTCQSGYYFSKDSQGCLPSASVNCVTTDSNPCQTVNNGVFVSVPNSCSDYYYCNNGVATQGSCPQGLNFDPIAQSCNYTIDYDCSMTNGDSADSINICAVVPNGIYFASSASCQLWQQCVNGALTVGSCASPYYFNVDTASCDYQDNVSCRQLNGDINSGTDGGYLAGTACTTNGAIVSDNITCVGYYLCNNNVYSYGTCSGQLYFNPPTKSCVNRIDAVNNCNRCENTNLMFVNLYQDNCVGYGYCNNGRVQSTAVCPDSAYFDEVAQACMVESEEPQYPVCNDALSGLSTTTSSPTTTTVAGAP